jgi:hypothetical protein
MTPEVKRIYDALLQPSLRVYNEIRYQIIDKVGYAAFRDRQDEAIKNIFGVAHRDLISERE